MTSTANSYVDCPICLEPLTTRADPRILPFCHHTFCKACIMSLRIYIDPATGSFSCPTCRVHYPIGLSIEFFKFDLHVAARADKLIPSSRVVPSAPSPPPPSPRRFRSISQGEGGLQKEREANLRNRKAENERKAPSYRRPRSKSECSAPNILSLTREQLVLAYHMR